MVKQFTCGLGLLCFAASGQALADPSRDCTRILSRVERLACFDEAAGTPSHQPAIAGRWSAPEPGAPSVARVVANERLRAPDDLEFRMTAQPEAQTGRKQVVISAPAIASAEPRPYLVISCVENITRLQLLTAQPIDRGRVTVRMRTERHSTAALPWQVLENGKVLDAGRGLPAIEQIKTLIGALRIQIISDHPAFDGLSFDAQGLDPLIDQARQACRW